jgi:hypothetical protein
MREPRAVADRMHVGLLASLGSENGPTTVRQAAPPAPAAYAPSCTYYAG